MWSGGKKGAKTRQQLKSVGKCSDHEFYTQQIIICKENIKYFHGFYLPWPSPKAHELLLKPTKNESQKGGRYMLEMIELTYRLNHIILFILRKSNPRKSFTPIINSNKPKLEWNLCGQSKKYSEKTISQLLNNR